MSLLYVFFFFFFVLLFNLLLLLLLLLVLVFLLLVLLGSFLFLWVLSSRVNDCSCCVLPPQLLRQMRQRSDKFDRLLAQEREMGEHEGEPEVFSFSLFLLLLLSLSL